MTPSTLLASAIALLLRAHAPIGSGLPPVLAARPAVAPQAPAPAAPRFPKFDDWFRRYRDGRVLFSMAAGKAPSGTEIDSFSPESPFRRALEECVRSKSRPGADRLLDLASFRFAPDPNDELAHNGGASPARVREEALQSIAKIRDRDVVEYLAKEVLLERGHTSPAKRAAAAQALGKIADNAQLLALYAATSDPSPEVRAAAIEATASYGDVRPTMAARWLADPDPEIRVVALAGVERILTRRKEPALREECLPAVRERLEDEDWRVRDRAVEVLLAFPSRDSIPRLIALLQSEKERLARHEGRKRVLERACDALVQITNVEIPARDPVRWQKWWDANQRTFQVGDHAAGRPRTQADSNYFTIAIKSDRLVFVIDVSGSMAQPYGGPGITGADPRDRSAEGSKLDRVKTELVRVLRNLGDDDRFQIVAFSTHVKAVFPKLMPGTKENRRVAEKFVASLTPGGGTAIWDALELALGFAGARGGEAGRDADTIFLLTDGEPTSGAITEPASILQAVGNANEKSHVQIHTIFVGPESSPGAELLSELARENWGEYRRVADR